MFCSYCGRELPDKSEYCRNCGARLNVIEGMATSNAHSPAIGAAGKNNFAVAGLVLSLVASTLAPILVFFLLGRAFTDFFAYIAVVAIICVLSIIVSFAGLTLSAAALHDAVKRRAPQKGIAVAGVVISAVKLLILFIEVMLLTHFTATTLAMLAFIESIIQFTINFFISI